MFKIYTDGGCRGNPGIGAWAMVVYQGHQEKGSKRGGSEHTTNNEMELLAVREAMSWATRAQIKDIEILTDSAYVCNGIKTWMHNWAKNGWKTANGGQVKNLELWKEVYTLYKGVAVTMTKVKGHSGDPGNERADLLCNVVMDEFEFTKHVLK